MNTPALPSYLQSRQSQRVAEGAADGIGGSLPPHISIRGNNFTLVDAAGNKADVPTKYLDVCFVDRSEVVCKQYYENDFVDGADDPPTCWSANGVAPSIEAAKPQAATCATCDWNARGSDVSKLSGKPIKACRDEKWTAVILPLYPTMVFQFKVTPGSFKAWKGYTDKFKGQQTDLSDVVTRLAFEKDKNGVLTFEAISYIDEALFKAREQAAIEKKTDVLVGRNDRPIQGAIADLRHAPAGGGQAPLPASTAGGQTATPSFVPQGQPSGTLIPPATHTATAEGFAHTASPTEPARRRRRTKAEMEAANAAGAAQTPASPAPAGFGGGNAGPAPFRPEPAPAGAPFGIATQAVPPDPAMKGMLDNIFGSPPRSAG
jgi:hypothetical protein